MVTVHPSLQQMQSQRQWWSLNLWAERVEPHSDTFASTPHWHNVGKTGQNLVQQWVYTYWTRANELLSQTDHSNLPSRQFGMTVRIINISPINKFLQSTCTCISGLLCMVYMLVFMYSIHVLYMPQTCNPHHVITSLDSPCDFEIAIEFSTLIETLDIYSA